ncbi:MAG: flagellin [Pirellulaceae bacterium]|nr:hypothetical protein [Planctomycetales bacterium]
MSLVIANNVSSLVAQHHLTKTSIGLKKSLERLSSGLKVNRGADGPAALVISEEQRAQIAGLSKAIENTEKAISLVQTAEGALTEINSLLVQIRSLALDSANTGVNDDDALAANQAEITNALDTINRIAENTQFGTKRLLDGSAGITGAVTSTDITFRKGTNDTAAGSYAVVVTAAGSRATANAPAVQSGNLANDEILTINGTNINLSAGLDQTAVIDRINQFTDQTGVVADANGPSGATRVYSLAFGSDTSITVVSNQTGVTSSGFGTSMINASGTDVAGTIDGVAFVGDGNLATVDSGQAKGLVVSIATNTGANAHQTVTGSLGIVTVIDNSLGFQIGPNQNQSAKVTVGRMKPDGLGLGVVANQFNSLYDIYVTSFATAQDAIGVIDAAIDDVTTQRGLLGAFQQNTLESTANNLRVTLENTVNAESVIRDTDFAKEVADYTKFQVLAQAGTSVLSNANQMSQLVLSLLQ